MQTAGSQAETVSSPLLVWLALHIARLSYNVVSLINCPWLGTIGGLLAMGLGFDLTELYTPYSARMSPETNKLMGSYMEVSTLGVIL